MFRKTENDIREVLSYIEKTALNIPVEKPSLRRETVQILFGIFLDIISRDENVKEGTKQLISETANLSSLDINITDISNNLNKYSGELSVASESHVTILEQTTASLSEMNTAIQNNTERTVNLAEDAEELVAINEENRLQVEEINSLKDSVMDNSATMQNEITDLSNISLQVDSIVDGVGEIAEETNLLALNASIEAARAGESGRGFAVVAEQIRTLAEDTKERLQSMQQFTTQIRGASNQSLTSVENTITSMDEMAQKIARLSSTFENSISSLERVLSSSAELAAVMEQVTASSNEINKVMSHLSADSETISGLAEAVLNDANEMREVAKNIEIIDTNLSSINRSFMKNVNASFVKINNDELITYLQEAISAHKNWLNSFLKMVQTKTIIPLQADGHRCKFGHFYHSVNVEHPELETCWKEIDSIHNELHAQVSVVTEQLEQNNYEAAEETAEYTASLSEQIIGRIERIIAGANTLSEREELIFA